LNKQAQPLISEGSLGCSLSNNKIIIFQNLENNNVVEICPLTYKKQILVKVSNITFLNN